MLKGKCAISRDLRVPVVFFVVEDEDVELSPGDRLRALRTRDLGLNQTRLAQLLGVSQKRISRFEMGLSRIPMTVLIALEEVLGVNPRWLLTGRGPKFLPSTESKRAAVRKQPA